LFLEGLSFLYVDDDDNYDAVRLDQLKKMARGDKWEYETTFLFSLFFS